jgi:hypothetical protein
MPSFDIKKIITSFLVLAVTAGTVAFIFSSFSLPSAPAAIQNITAETHAPDSPTIGTSTLQAESLPASAFADVFATSTPIDASSTNLTDQVANSLAGAIVQANPNGPQTASDGTSQVAVPANLDDTVANLVAEKSFSFISSPVDAEKIKIQKDYTPEDVQSYFSSLKKILNGIYGDGGIATLSKSTGDISPDTVTAIDLLFSQAEEQLYALNVPAPAEKIHHAYLAYVTYQKNVFDPAIDSDPVRSVALSQSYNSGAAIREQDIQSAMDEFVKNPPVSPRKTTSLLENLFLPKVAHAQFAAAVFDVPTEVSTAGHWLKTIAEWLYHLALNVLRQQIVHRIVMQTVNWINGNGKPQFITDWGGFLDQAGTNAANVAISNLNDLTHGQLCSSFGPLITLQLQRQFLNGPPAPTCTIDKIINNVDNFYNSFENGGWIAYGALTSPNGNYYGSILQAQISVQNKLAAAQGNANSNAVANKGFPGQKVCVEEGKLTVHHDAVPPTPGTPGTPDFTLPDGTVLKGIPGTPGTPGAEAYDTKEASPNAPCAKEQTLTPGGTVAYQLDNALGSSITNIISATDISAVVDALINSAFQKLVKFTTTGLTGLLKGDQNAPVSVTPSMGTDPCVGLTGDEYRQCKGIAGASASTTQTGTDISGDQQSMIGDVKSDITRLGVTLSADADWLGIAASAESEAIQLSSVCPSQQSTASSTIDLIRGLRATIQGESDAITRTPEEVCTAADSIHSWLAKFQCLQGDIMSAKTPGELSTSNSFLAQYTQQAQGLLTNSDATTRSTNIKNIKDALDRNLSTPPLSCGSQIITAP